MAALIPLCGGTNPAGNILWGMNSNCPFLYFTIDKRILPFFDLHLKLYLHNVLTVTIVKLMHPLKIVRSV